MNAPLQPLAALPYMPLNVAWMEQAAAYSHEDRRLFKAYFKIVVAAWRSTPAATIPASRAYLSEVTGLPMEDVARFEDVLTEGFVSCAGARLQHEQLAQLAAAIMGRYGREVDEFALAAAMTAQDPDQFCLVAVESAQGKTKGKRACPRGFGFKMFPRLRDWLAVNGYPTPEDQEWALGQFLEYVAAKNPLNVNWEAAARIWWAKELEYGRLPPSRKQRSGGWAAAAAPMAARTAAAQDLNAAAFADANARGAARSGSGARDCAPAAGGFR